jgi:hypothetical protein
MRRQRDGGELGVSKGPQQLDGSVNEQVSTFTTIFLPRHPAESSRRRLCTKWMKSIPKRL